METTTPEKTGVPAAGLSVDPYYQNLLGQMDADEQTERSLVERTPDDSQVERNIKKDISQSQRRATNESQGLLILLGAEAGVQGYPGEWADYFVMVEQLRGDKLVKEKSLRRLTFSYYFPMTRFGKLAVDILRIDPNTQQLVFNQAEHDFKIKHCKSKDVLYVSVRPAEIKDEDGKVIDVEELISNETILEAVESIKAKEG